MSLGQECPWTTVPWTNVATPLLLYLLFYFLPYFYLNLHTSFYPDCFPSPWLLPYLIVRPCEPSLISWHLYLTVSSYHGKIFLLFTDSVVSRSASQSIESKPLWLKVLLNQYHTDTDTDTGLKIHGNDKTYTNPDTWLIIHTNADINTAQSSITIPILILLTIPG